MGFGFPNPVGWAIDKVTGFVGGVATKGFEAIIGGLTAWVVDAVVWVVGGVFNFFLDSTDPNVQADWFLTGHGPYATTVSIGARLLVLFVLAGIIQGTLNGDVGGMLRRIALDLPVSIIGMIGLVTVTQVLIRLTDALSGQVLDNFQDDISKFGTVVASLTTLTGGPATAFVVFVLGLVTVLAGLVLVAELVVRAALIYIVVALAPLVFAARLWPATKGASRKLLDLLVALIVSKLVIAIALAVAAAAAVGAGSGGEVTALPTTGGLRRRSRRVGHPGRRHPPHRRRRVRRVRVLAAADRPAVADDRSRRRRPRRQGRPGPCRAPGDDDGQHRADGVRPALQPDRQRPSRGERRGRSTTRRRSRRGRGGAAAGPVGVAVAAGPRPPRRRRPAAPERRPTRAGARATPHRPPAAAAAASAAVRRRAVALRRPCRPTRTRPVQPRASGAPRSRPEPRGPRWRVNAPSAPTGSSRSTRRGSSSVSGWCSARSLGGGIALGVAPLSAGVPLADRGGADRRRPRR